MVEQLGNISYAAYELKLVHLFRPRATVQIKCVACRHVGPLDLWEVVRIYGRWTRLSEIERHMRCSKCRVLGVCHLQISWDHALRSRSENEP